MARKGGRQKSLEWVHVILDPDNPTKVTCSYCRKEFSKKSERVTAHMAGCKAKETYDNAQDNNRIIEQEDEEVAAIMGNGRESVSSQRSGSSSSAGATPGPGAGPTPSPQAQSKRVRTG